MEVNSSTASNNSDEVIESRKKNNDFSQQTYLVTKNYLYSFFRDLQQTQCVNLIDLEK